MYFRYVINKVNPHTGCFQGILTTLGTMKHKGEFDSAATAQIDALFKSLDEKLLTPPEIERPQFKKSISWLKDSSVLFEAISEKMIEASQILNKKGYQILILNSKSLNTALYEDSEQILVEALVNEFSLSTLIFENTLQ